MDISNQIRTRRAAAGMSQDDLAQAIYVSRQTVSNWENDRTYPDVQSLLLLSNLFGTTIDVLVKGDLEMMQTAIEKQENEDAIRMRRLSWIMVGATLVALVALIVGMQVLGKWGFLLFLAPWAVAMVAAVRVERIKRDNNVQTYREISAFMEGRPVEEARAAGGSHAGLAGSVVTKALAGALVGVAILVIAMAVLRLIGA